MLHYNVLALTTLLGVWSAEHCREFNQATMTHHHHHPGHAHPSPVVSSSLLRLSALERLAASAAISVVLWGAVLWALS
jgi:hypothetical protein